MKKIAIFQNELGMGGIQKSLINLLRALDYSKVSVDLYLSQKDDFWKEKLPEQVRVCYLKPTHGFFSFIPFDAARSVLKYDFLDDDYDLAVDFNSYQCSCAVGATTVGAKRRAMWIHNDVKIKLNNEWKYRVLWHFFKGKFKYYDVFVPVSAALEKPFRRMSGTDKPCTVIQNVINVSDIREKMQVTPDDVSVDSACMNFVALGRLCHQKGYDIMLEEFKKACEYRDDLRLYIIGDGPDRAALEKHRDEAGLKDKVFFLGNKTNPYCYMKLMDALLSTSRYEGQPLNIMEAMAIGLPLYCTKNLEAYTEGLRGYENISQAIAGAKKEGKHPDDLKEYNNKILESFYEL
ncbi:MAG: glycosyltransferase [Eubacteriales bacterium]|nr:glycosyltransferase [Eubacteriales bacterium]